MFQTDNNGDYCDRILLLGSAVYYINKNKTKCEKQSQYLICYSYSSSPTTITGINGWEKQKGGKEEL